MNSGVRFPKDSDESPSDPIPELRERFQDRVARGRYADLLHPPLRIVLRQGAAIRGVEEELGAIRFALAKLLVEEQDASKLAAGVARLTSASVQAMKLGQSISDETDASLADLLNQILIDLEKESQVARAARKERNDDGTGWQDSQFADP